LFISLLLPHFFIVYIFKTRTAVSAWPWILPPAVFDPGLLKCRIRGLNHIHYAYSRFFRTFTHHLACRVWFPIFSYFIVLCKCPVQMTPTFSISIFEQLILRFVLLFSSEHKVPWFLWIGRLLSRSSLISH